LRPSDGARLPALAPAVILALSTLAASGCSSQRLVVVDPESGVTSDGGVDMAIQPGLLDGIVGYWRLDDAAGSASARDGSGRGNNGVLVNLNSATAWVQGKSGLSLLINDGWVVVTPSASIDAISDGVTVAGWVYLDGNINLWATMLSRQIGGTIEQHYHLSLNPDRRPNLFVTTATRTTILLAPDPVPPRTWVHLAGTYDGAFARLFVDGVPVVSMPITGTFAADTTPVILGGNVNDASGVPNELFPGRIDEVMLYRRALGAEEIALLRGGALWATGTPTAPRDAAAE
jgi:hypothetical protein